MKIENITVEIPYKMFSDYKKICNKIPHFSWNE